MNKFIVCAVAFLLPATCVLANGKNQENAPLQEWLTYYYVEKDAARVPDFLAYLQSSDMLEKHPDAVPSIEAFLSMVFAQNPEKEEVWGHNPAFKGKTKEVVDYALKPAVAPQDIRINTSTDINRLWGAFYASGNERYLQMIEGVLDKNKPLTGDAKQDEAIRATASWSLGSNMTRHEAVDRFLERESAHQAGELGDTLRRIVSSVKKQREAHALPKRNGEFSAMMFITDPKLANTELANASNDIIHFKEMVHARKGDKRTVVIVFAGMQLSLDYHADVTYDVQQIDPQGKVYSDIQDIEGLKQKVPTRFRIFHNQAAIFIAFDRKDKPGIYKVHVLLKDNIGKRTIPMDTKIILQR